MGRAALLGLLLSLPAHADILQNDSAEEGEPVAFYNAIGGGEGFWTIHDVPERLGQYQICALYAWIGPDDFNVFEIRIHEVVDDEGTVGELIWHSDLDAYQLFGSEVAVNRVDLRPERIITDHSRIRVWMNHVEGFAGPPTIVSDADGITPGRNGVSVFLRNGSWHTCDTDELMEGGVPERPPGDWVLRAEVVPINEDCPEPDDILPNPDVGVVQPPDGGGDEVLDMGGGPDDPDLGGDQVADGGGSGDDPDQGGDQVADGGGGGGDFGSGEGGDDAFGGGLDSGSGDSGDRQPGAFRVESIVPAEGPPHRNTEVVIKGVGFPFGVDGEVRGFVGDERLLELDVLSTSTITAIVPAGLDPGIYDISVEEPGGQVEVLPQAFTVLGGDQLTGDGGVDGGGRAAAEGCCRVSPRGPGEAPWLLLLLGFSRRRRRRRR